MLQIIFFVIMLVIAPYLAFALTNWAYGTQIEASLRNIVMYYSMFVIGYLLGLIITTTLKALDKKLVTDFDN